MFDILKLDGEDKGLLEDLAGMCDEIERALLKEEIDPAQIDNEELEVNIGNVRAPHPALLPQ